MFSKKIINFFRSIFICVKELDYIKIWGGTNPSPHPFALNVPKHETSTRKEPQKRNSALNTLDLEGALSMKYF